MTLDKTLLVVGMTLVLMAGCGGGEAETIAVQDTVAREAAAQAVAPAEVVDGAAVSAAQIAISGTLRSAIEMHAQTSVPALACGSADQASLEVTKTEARKLARAEGIDDAAFDRIYAASQREGRARWESAPAAQRASACDEWNSMSD